MTNGAQQTHIIRSHKPLGVGGAKSLCAYASAVRWGRGDFLYFTDNDMYFTDGWLDKMLEAWRGIEESTRICRAYSDNPSSASDVLVLGGYNNPFQGPTGSFQISKQQDIRFFDALGGASMLMDWCTWDEYGPFDHNAKGVRQSEDVAFGRLVTQAGYRLAAVWPHVVHDCGKTDTFGVKVPYADIMPEVKGAEVI